MTDYLTELTQSECREYLRPNFFTNTPDILPPILQRGGRPAFQMRLVLAATLSSVYGIYNSFELCEATPSRTPRNISDSEKYEYKVWDWDRPGNIKDYIRRVNQRAPRKSGAARVHQSALLSRRIQIDPVLRQDDGRSRQHGVRRRQSRPVRGARGGLSSFRSRRWASAPTTPTRPRILLSGERHLWRGAQQRLRLDPQHNPAAHLPRHAVPARRISNARLYEARYAGRRSALVQGRHHL